MTVCCTVVYHLPMSRRIASTEFRVTYHNLAEPVEVTVLGRMIGRYIPTEFGRYWEPADEGTPSEPCAPVANTTSSDGVDAGTGGSVPKEKA